MIYLTKELMRIRNKIYDIFIGLVVMALLPGCSEEPWFATDCEPTEVTLSLRTQIVGHHTINLTRSVTDDENKLEDLHFYVFNEEGKLTGYKKLTNATTPGPKDVKIKTWAGKSYIYALANLESSTYYLSEADRHLLTYINEDAPKLSSLTREQFLALEFKRQYGDASSIISPDPIDAHFLMSGYMNNGKLVTINTGGLEDVTDKTVKLYRILAKNTFTIKAGAADITFTPKTYELHNIPVGGKLVNISGDATAADVESSYVGMAGDSFTFYLPENIRNYEGGSITQWKDREKNSYTDGTKTFTNAPANSSYIVINGDYKSGNETASVSYTIHFGNFNSTTGSLTSFEVKRNHHYKYAITVNGVNDIRVEAQATIGEDNPYVEGLIISNEGGVAYNLDAHYEARVIAFSQEKIKNLKDQDKGYILRITTPFGHTDNLYITDEGIFNAYSDKLASFDSDGNLTNISDKLFNSGEKDYLWMKFVKNTSSNRISGTELDKVGRYPGDNNETASTYGRWMNVFQLLRELYRKADDDSYFQEGKAYYTCFVDEYYYANKSWIEYANKEPRTMLLANSLDVSADGQSLYAKVAYSISQKSITTFYRQDFAGSPYGTECITEEELDNGSYYLDKNYFGYQDRTDNWAGRDNTLSSRNVLNSKWYSGDRINVVGDRQPFYKWVIKACMSRNRDLNGDGIIQANEIHWYLGSVGQYNGLWYGETAMATVEPDTRLFRTPMSELKGMNVNYQGLAKYHYFTSSTGGYGIFWAEEGLSTGNRNDGTYQFANLIRCMRTLESNNLGLKDADTYYIYSNNIFDMEGMIATRGFAETALSKHHEREEANNLYSKFRVAKGFLTKEMVDGSGSGYYTTYDYFYNLSQDPCQKYYEALDKSDVGTWRTPNQKELSLIVANGLVKENAMSSTDFSGSEVYGGYKVTDGFWNMTDHIGLGKRNSTSHSCKFRCVRDVKKE